MSCLQRHTLKSKYTTSNLWSQTPKSFAKQQNLVPDGSKHLRNKTPQISRFISEFHLAVTFSLRRVCSDPWYRSCPLRRNGSCIEQKHHFLRIWETNQGGRLRNHPKKLWWFFGCLIDKKRKGWSFWFLNWKQPKVGLLVACGCYSAPCYHIYHFLAAEWGLLLCLAVYGVCAMFQKNKLVKQRNGYFWFT